MANSSKIIRIGTRTSQLALAQSAEVHLLLDPFLEGKKIEIVPLTTSGDRIQDRTLADIGGKGLFIKELEEALIQNKIDIAIHSAKDVPPILHDETTLAAFTKRLDARDCLISKKYNSLKDLPKGAVIGTSSARRKAILLHLRPDLKIVTLRGNVTTRLNKIAKGEIDAAILAVCGLERLGKELKIKEVIDKNTMLPSGGQGTLALQICKNNKEIHNLLQKINDKNTELTVKCERAFLRELEASCSSPVSSHAIAVEDNLVLKTIIFDYDGKEIFSTESNCKANLENATKTAIAAAHKTKNEAKDLLARITA